MARRPDTAREAAESLSALASSIESADWTRAQFGRGANGSQLHARQHKLLAIAIRHLARMHLPQARAKRAKDQQLRLVA